MSWPMHSSTWEKLGRTLTWLQMRRWGGKRGLPVTLSFSGAFPLRWRSWDFSSKSRAMGQDCNAKAGQNVLMLQKVGVCFPRIRLKSKSTHGKAKLDNILSDRRSNGLQSPTELGKMFRAPAPTFSPVVVEALLNIAIFRTFKIRWVTKKVVTSAGFHLLLCQLTKVFW